jgi:hypothetical protein
MTRPLRPVIALISVLVAAVVGTAGCTTTLEGAAAADPAPLPTEGRGSDPVAWADRICDAVLKFATPATSAPDFTSTSDLPAVQRTFGDYLNTLVSGLDAGRTQLKTVGQAPEPAGDDAVGRTDSAMQALERDVGGAKAALDGADVNNPANFMTTLTQVESTLAGMNTPNPLGELATAPRLQRAAERAARCQQLSALGRTAPR